MRRLSWRRRLIDEQRDLIVQQRLTIRAQAAALLELTDAAHELTESAQTWRTLALNTADVFTAAFNEGNPDE